MLRASPGVHCQRGDDTRAGADHGREEDEGDAAYTIPCEARRPVLQQDANHYGWRDEKHANYADARPDWKAALDRQVQRHEAQEHNDADEDAAQEPQTTSLGPAAKNQVPKPAKIAVA